MTADLMTLLIRETIALSLGLALVLVLRLPVRRVVGPRLAYALWLAAPVAMLIAALPAPTLTLAGTAPVAIPSLSALAGPERLDALPAAASGGVSLLLVLAVVWALGVLATAALAISRQHRFVGSLGRLARRYAFGSEVFEAEREDISPALVGALRPRLVLPSGFTERFGEDERELVIAHERLHLRAGDPQLNALALTLQCLFWFNPLVHFAARAFRVDQELACDAAVVELLPTARRSYAAAMLKTQMAWDAPALGCSWPTRSQHALTERIALLARPAPARRRRVAGGSGAGHRRDARGLRGVGGPAAALGAGAGYCRPSACAVGDHPRP
jgi:beta-lactamase regulating signal transducer with metallopeptidase domain